MTNWDFFEKKAAEVGFKTIDRDREVVQQMYNAVLKGMGHPDSTATTYRDCVPLQVLEHEDALMARFLLNQFGFEVFFEEEFGCYIMPLKK